VASETGGWTSSGQRSSGRSGELIAVDSNGLRSRIFAAADPKGCLFEYVYLAWPDTMISGRRLHSVRVEGGVRSPASFPRKRIC
jgi:amidophosphoribosyltransferase